MELSCGTSAPESMACAGNIFVGIAESPLLIRPFIDNMIWLENYKSFSFTILRAFIVLEQIALREEGKILHFQGCG